MNENGKLRILVKHVFDYSSVNEHDLDVFELFNVKRVPIDIEFEGEILFKNSKKKLSLNDMDKFNAELAAALLMNVVVDTSKDLPEYLDNITNIISLLVTKSANKVTRHFLGSNIQFESVFDDITNLYKAYISGKSYRDFVNDEHDKRTLH